MVSFTFRKHDMLFPLGLLVLTVVGAAWNQSQGKPVMAVPLIGGVIIAFAQLLINGYYRSFAHLRALEYRARLEALPLLKLKAELVRELSLGRAKVDALMAEASALQAQQVTAAQLASLDKASVQALLLAISQPDQREVWRGRLFGFTSGVVASLVASFIYELVKR